MPVLQPAELWQRSGRYGIDELFKLRDRKGGRARVGDDARRAADHACRESDPLLPRPAEDPLPLPGPRRVTRRGRAPACCAPASFIMKGLLQPRPRPRGSGSCLRPARGGLRSGSSTGPVCAGTACAADVGFMGGHGSDEYMAPCAARRERARHRRLLRGEPRGRERAGASGWRCRRRCPSRSWCRTPGATTIHEVATLLGIPAGALLKGVPGGARR